MAKKEVRHILGLSGGKDSTALALYLKDKVPDIEYFFCDTHKELPETYAFLKKLEVVLGKKILGKPRNRDDAHSMLELLSGKEHDVITGFCIIDPSGELVHSGHITTTVKIKRLSDEEITAYIDTGEPFGKAGGYAIQGIGSFMVEGIKGSYSNVVGLPVCALIKALQASGALKKFP